MKQLDEGRIRRLTKNRAALKEFPFLEQPLAKAACCGEQPKIQADLNKLKLRIASLPLEQQKRLLELAGLDGEAKLIYRGDNGTERKVLGGK